MKTLSVLDCVKKKKNLHVCVDVHISYCSSLVIWPLSAVKKPTKMFEGVLFFFLLFTNSLPYLWPAFLSILRLFFEHFSFEVRDGSAFHVTLLVPLLTLLYEPCWAPFTLSRTSFFDNCCVFALTSHGISLNVFPYYIFTLITLFKHNFYSCPFFKLIAELICCYCEGSYQVVPQYSESVSVRCSCQSNFLSSLITS